MKMRLANDKGGCRRRIRPGKPAGFASERDPDHLFLLKVSTALAAEAIEIQILE